MLTVTPTGQVLGATIAGLDLSQPLSHGAFAQILTALGQYAHQLQEKFRYLYTWSDGDVLVWEHFGTIHRAVADYGPDEHRLMKRCQVMATKIFAPAFRKTVALEPVSV